MDTAATCYMWHLLSGVPVLRAGHHIWTASATANLRPSLPHGGECVGHQRTRPNRVQGRPANISQPYACSMSVMIIGHSQAGRHAGSSQSGTEQPLHCMQQLQLSTYLPCASSTTCPPCCFFTVHETRRVRVHPYVPSDAVHWFQCRARGPPASLRSNPEVPRALQGHGTPPTARAGAGARGNPRELA